MINCQYSISSCAASLKNARRKGFSEFTHVERGILAPLRPSLHHPGYLGQGREEQGRHKCKEGPSLSAPYFFYIVVLFFVVHHSQMCIVYVNQHGGGSSLLAAIIITTYSFYPSLSGGTFLSPVFSWWSFPNAYILSRIRKRVAAPPSWPFLTSFFHW